MSVQGLRVLVTAGASGIGRAIADRFTAAQAKVFVCDISEAAIAQYRAASAGVLAGICDVTEPEQVETAVSLAREQLGGEIQILINNAGVPGPRMDVEEIAYDAWNRTLTANISSMFYFVKNVAPGMKARRDGAIINIGTTSARTGLPGRLPYVVSKAAVIGLTQNLARELGPFGIRCNCVSPGAVDGDRGRQMIAAAAQRSGRTAAEVEADVLRYVSMRTWVSPSDVAETVVFLASREAAKISGQNISVCGNVEWEG